MIIEKRKSELYTIDERGVKAQLREDGVQFDGVEMVQCPKDMVRGSHYHDAKHEYVHVFTGRVKLEYSAVGSDVQELVVGRGEYVYIPPGTRHRLIGLEDSVLVIPFRGSSSIEDVHPWTD